MKLRWQDRIPDTEVLERTRILIIHAMLRQVRLRMSGYLVRMDDERLRNSKLGGQSDRRCKGQKGGSQVTSTVDQHRQCPSPANVPTLSTHILRANRLGRTSSNSMQQQSHKINFCYTYLRHHDDDHPNPW
ncbi:unnamed protein product [Schistocephalus solidus]|uniref:Uncharacterized protein n=1 Tax=Schistocephalus solidus TaxID=70667 RepID=A0A183TEL4_SCHSO|nr:unnamed protein product [Schistocephalus solidus]